MKTNSLNLVTVGQCTPWQTLLYFHCFCLINVPLWCCSSIEQR